MQEYMLQIVGDLVQGKSLGSSFLAALGAKFALILVVAI
jgi:hypothetical protein